MFNPIPPFNRGERLSAQRLNELRDRIGAGGNIVSDGSIDVRQGPFGTHISIPPAYHAVPRHAYFRNDSSDEMPAFAVMKVIGPDTAIEGGEFLKCDEPDTQADAVYAVNARIPIPQGGFGYCTFLETNVYALYDDTDTPAINEIWGPDSGSFLLHKGKPGFKIIGGPRLIDGDDVVLVRHNPLSRLPYAFTFNAGALTISSSTSVGLPLTGWSPSSVPTDAFGDGDADDVGVSYVSADNWFLNDGTSTFALTFQGRVTLDNTLAAGTSLQVEVWVSMNSVEPPSPSSWSVGNEGARFPVFFPKGTAAGAAYGVSSRLIPGAYQDPGRAYRVYASCSPLPAGITVTISGCLYFEEYMGRP